MGDPAPRAELIFDHEISAELADDLETAFRDLGFDTSARRRLPHRGPAELTWLMLAALPLQSFLSGLGSELAKELYAKVKRLRLPGRKTEGAQHLVPLVLQDTNSELRIILEADLPAEAIRELVSLDLSGYRAGPLHYDQHRKKWRSELDEAEAAPRS